MPELIIVKHSIAVDPQTSAITIPPNKVDPVARHRNLGYDFEPFSAQPMAQPSPPLSLVALASREEALKIVTG